jgi:hypothetical protein
VIAGHFGFAAAVKSRERHVPLWALMLATVWLDVVFVPLFLTGIETIEQVPGTDGAYGTGIIYADYTHSLLGALALSALFGTVAAITWSRRTATVLAAVVFSHWLLDLIVHRLDMPLLPGNAGHFPRSGFGLWRSPIAAMIVELAIVLVGSYLYWRAAQQTAAAAGGGSLRRANLAGALVLLFGLTVLALDVTGILG